MQRQSSRYFSTPCGDVMESARRVYNDTERSAESYASVTEAAEALTKRTGLEKERFKSLYDVDYYNKNNDLRYNHP